jgi:hypothetical protein
MKISCYDQLSPEGGALHALYESDKSVCEISWLKLGKIALHELDLAE